MSKNPEAEPTDSIEEEHHLLSSAKEVQKLMDKNPEKAQGLLTNLIVKLYEIELVQEAANFWNNLDDSTKKGLSGEGWRGFIGQLIPGGKELIFFTRRCLDAGIIEPPTGMDMDAEADSVEKKLEYAPYVTKAAALFLGPEVEAILPVIEVLAGVNKHYQPAMKKAREAIGKTKETPSTELEKLANEIGAEPVSLEQGMVRKEVDQDQCFPIVK